MVKSQSLPSMPMPMMRPMMIFVAIEKVGQKAPMERSQWRKALKDALYATKNLKSLTGNLTLTQMATALTPEFAIYKTSVETSKAWCSR